MKGSPLPVGVIFPQELSVATATDLDVFRCIQRLRRQGQRLPLFSRFHGEHVFSESNTGSGTCQPFNLIYDANDSPYAVPGARFRLHFLRLQITIRLPGSPPTERATPQRHFHLRLVLVSEWDTTAQGSLDQTVVLNSIPTYPTVRGARSFQYFSNHSTTPDVFARGWDYIPLWFARSHLSNEPKGGHVTWYQPAQYTDIPPDGYVVTSQPAAIEETRPYSQDSHFCCYDVVVPLDCIHEIRAESTNHVSSGSWRMFPMLVWDVQSRPDEVMDVDTAKITVNAELIYTFE